MINDLNRLVDYVEGNLCGEIDITVVARSSGVTGYHLRRMFSSLAGMPLSEYVRRRRMTVAAGDVLAGDDLLSIAVRYGYGSAEAFGRAFRTVHGIGPTEARRTGGPLRTQQQLRFRLTVEGSSRMDARIVNRPTIRLVGHATRVPLIYEGVNPHIAEFTESLPAEVHSRLYALGDTHEEGPGGLLAVNDDVAPDSDEGAELTYMHGVAVTGDSVAPDDLDVITVPAGGGWCSGRPGRSPNRCRRCGRPRQPSGFPRTRGNCARGRPWCRRWSTTRISPPRPANSGSRWSRVRPERGDRAEAGDAWRRRGPCGRLSPLLGS